MAQNRKVSMKKNRYVVTVTPNAKINALFLRFQMIRLTRYRLKKFSI